jgi:hypothetical protein
MTRTPDQTLNDAGAKVVNMPPRLGIHILTPAQCAAMAPRDYIIKGVLARADHAQICGLPASGKSALAPTIGYHVALGIDLFGRRVKPTKVLYIAAEDGSGMKARVAALHARMGDAPLFMLQPVPIDLMNETSGHAAEIGRLIALHKPGLVFIDTIARAFPGLRENEPESMGRVVKVCRDLTLICDSAVVSIHHPPKAGDVTPRGHGVLNGDLDVSLYVEGSGRDVRTVTMGKNRNGASDLSFQFSLAIHDFGPDEDGDPVTAPVAEIAADTQHHSRAKEARLKDKPAIMLRELRALIEADGEIVTPGNDYPPVRAVGRLALRRRLIDRGWFSEGVLCVALDKQPTITRAGYAVENNGLTPLKNNGFVSFNREWIWLL